MVGLARCEKKLQKLGGKGEYFRWEIIEKHSMKMVLGEYMTGENKEGFGGGGSAGDEKDCRREGD